MAQNKVSYMRHIYSFLEFNSNDHITVWKRYNMPMSDKSLVYFILRHAAEGTTKHQHIQAAHNKTEAQNHANNNISRDTLGRSTVSDAKHTRERKGIR
jgi:hypothetical protein